MLNAGEIKELVFNKVTVYLAFSFRKKKSTKQNKASKKLSIKSFGATGSSLRRNKATNSGLLTTHFLTAMKILGFGNLFKLFRLAITFAREVCHCELLWG